MGNLNQKNENNTQTKTSANKPLTIIGIILCVILLPILIVNVTLIIKSYVNKDEVPSIGKMFPMIVLTDSMYPQIQSGDLIICNKVNTSDIKEGDVISFFDPSGNGTSVVTHRVVGITEEDGVLAFKTKGDANNAEDNEIIESSIVGKVIISGFVFFITLFSKLIFLFSIKKNIYLNCLIQKKTKLLLKK